MDEEIEKEIEKLREDVVEVNTRVEKIKEIISSYFSMSSDFALSSLKTSLKEI